MKDWYEIPTPETRWLVDGLIPADAHASICGKPKAGKSTLIRNLIVSVVKGRPFLGRQINVPANMGRVLYVHLDRKDQTHRVSTELTALGITKEEACRIELKISEDLPETFEARLKWLQDEISKLKPDMVVIDLLWQFVLLQNTNDYNAVLKGINDLQDALNKADYKGALVVALHSRKSTNTDEPFDDLLGSTGQRGSFSTNIMLNFRRNENVYTIMSDQTERDEHYGEIRETIIERQPDGTLILGEPLHELVKEKAEARVQSTLRKVLTYVSQQPGCEMEEIEKGLNMAKKTILKCLDMAPEIWSKRGNGIKGDPYKYFVDSSDLTAFEKNPELWGSTVHREGRTLEKLQAVMPRESADRLGSTPDAVGIVRSSFTNLEKGEHAVA